MRSQRLSRGRRTGFISTATCARTGWWYYYLLALAYKIPEGTLLLLVLTIGSLRYVARSSADWADEITLFSVPAVIVIAMSFFTDINLGLRYVLPVLPFGFIAAGRLVPWLLDLSGSRKRVMMVLMSASLGATIAATLEIHPDYLAYFNRASGGADCTPARLIDSNLDWGQDLVALQKWWKRDDTRSSRWDWRISARSIPSIFRLRGEPFDWFLPPVRPAATEPMLSHTDLLVGPAKKLTPGYYAVSASLVYGLPWRLYDSAPPDKVPAAWGPAWNARRARRLLVLSPIRADQAHRALDLHIPPLREEDVASRRFHLYCPRREMIAC